MSKRYSVFHVPLMSFFSRDLYRDVALNWRGTGFLYMLFLLTFCWVPPMVVLQNGLTHFADEVAPPIVNEWPTITLSDGRTSVDAEEPYYLRLSPTGSVLAVVDTTGQIASLADTEALVLLTGTQLYIKGNGSQTQVHELGELDDIVIDRNKVMGWLELLRDRFVYVAFPVALLASFLFRVVQALIYGGVGMVMAGSRAQLPYSALLRLAVVAVTPVIIIKTILLTAGVGIPGHGSLIGVAVAFGYLYLGIKSAGTSEPSL